MRLSESLIPTIKETPAEAQITSHRLMLRAGLVRQMASGIYAWLPAGLRVLRNIEFLVREEQNACGAQEILMPTIQSADLWRESGRYEAYGKEMLRITDRHERELLFGPTNEEMITAIMRDATKSYRELPQILYHIQWKFRDEVRPRFGAKYVGGLMPGQVVDYLPEEQLGEIRNLGEFAGMLALDKWTANANGRQAVFVRKARERRYSACFIDQGYCFHAGEWRFEDSPLRGVYPRNAVYAGVSGWNHFEPWLTRMETMDAGVAWRAAEEIPPEWYGGDLSELEALVEKLLKRRSRIRELIEEFGRSDRMPFPKWVEVGKRWVM